ncbi:MAG: serine/threonine-protein kinase [Thermodesulfobacteriota bacterium]
MTPFQPFKFGKYSVVQKIASGGMAELLKAKMHGEHGFEKILAIKKIHSHFEAEQEMLTSFIDEARLAAQLQHQNIVQVVDFGSVDGEYFIAMEYLEGYDLRTILNLAASSTHQLDIAHALFIVSRACEGLQYAHTLKDSNGVPLNIVHRDISPANIFITTEGEVKIIDFGIARAASHNRLTTVGSVKGKMQYMAPEQALGSHIDHRVDIYSVGAVLYEIFSGHLLFEGGGFEIFEKVKTGQFVPPEKAIPNQSDDFYQIVHRSLAADPDERYQSCLDMQDDIESYLTTHNLRPTNRSLKENVESLSPKSDQQDVNGAVPVEATEVCDVFFNTSGSSPQSKSNSLPQRLVMSCHHLVGFFRDHLPRIAVGGGVALLLLLAFLHLSKRYTAFNIWVPANSTLYSINYKGGGALLPAGCAIQDILVDESANTISFNTEDKRRITIRFKPKWHPGRSVVDFADMFVTSKKFKKITRGMSGDEVAAIKSGVLVDGMSKSAVLVAYGPPPEHKTASLEANRWTYWRGRFDNHKICFDEKDRLLSSCPAGIAEQDKNALESLGGKILGLFESE